MRWLNDAVRGRSARRLAGAGPTALGQDSTRAAGRPAPSERVEFRAIRRGTSDPISASEPSVRLRHADRL